MGGIDRRALLTVGLAAGAASAAPEEPYRPEAGSLRRHATPEWFRDAKFGVSAQWTPQSLPEQGDWYARNMYVQGSAQYAHHLATYGHPSKVGYKELCRLWRGERWDPAALVEAYRRAGARYLVALANHHDGFDCWASRWQRWNSVNLGPRRDIVGTWMRLARAAGLRFGVEVFAAQNWSWFQPAHGADATGPLQGVPYDGRLTAADAAGAWWRGYDPQALYGPAHAPDAPPSPAYARNFRDRTVDLIDRYAPDLVFYTDRGLPLGRTGLELAARQFNAARRRGQGAALLCKNPPDDLRGGVLADQLPADRIEPEPWQMDICIGDWHYRRGQVYKTAADVIPYLVDVVSKNGALLLNLPIRADGTLDDQELAILDDIGRWMAVNGEGLFATRPWTVFGEGPTRAEPVDFPYRKARFTAQDVRFTVKGETLFAFGLAWPADGRMTIRSLGRQPLEGRAVARVELLGAGPLAWRQDEAELHVELPLAAPAPYVHGLRIRFEG